MAPLAYLWRHLGRFILRGFPRIKSGVAPQDDGAGSGMRGMTLVAVMAGLVPAIHVFAKKQERRGCPHSRA